jgi:hypothetical protein
MLYPTTETLHGHKALDYHEALNTYKQMDRFRKRFKGRIFSDSVEVIREDRDR